MVLHVMSLDILSPAIPWEEGMDISQISVSLHAYPPPGTMVIFLRPPNNLCSRRRTAVSLFLPFRAQSLFNDWLSSSQRLSAAK
jgi:hypothetical protein